MEECEQCNRLRAAFEALRAELWEEGDDYRQRTVEALDPYNGDSYSVDHAKYFSAASSAYQEAASKVRRVSKHL
jgi:hypothetical protein